MSLQKAKAFVIVLAALLLSGCGQALSEREIVRAVFFVQQQGSYSACLLLADQNAGEDGTHYKTASALGVTPAQALHRAEMALPVSFTTDFSSWPPCRRAVTGLPRRSLVSCCMTKPSLRRSFQSLYWTVPTTAGRRTLPPV